MNPSFGSISYGQSNLGSNYNGGNLSIRERSARVATQRNHGAAIRLAVQRELTRIEWLGESAQMQFRGPAFNAFNRVNLGGISSSMNSTTFGRVTGTGAARRFQFGMRLTF